jgi:V/A-type H+-transporting ATPase subunit F
VKYGVKVLCGAPAAAGFRLAGLRPVEADANADAVRRLQELLGQEETGVILIEESLYDGLPEPLRRILAGRALPMIVPFPGPRWAAAPERREAFIAQLLQQAIGYRVRLE